MLLAVQAVVVAANPTATCPPRTVGNISRTTASRTRMCDRINLTVAGLLFLSVEWLLSRSIVLTAGRFASPLTHGGDGWESNPPRTPQQRPANSFEDRGANVRNRSSASTGV